MVLIYNHFHQENTYVKLGSISTDGSQNLNGGTEYKIYFKETNNLTSFLGLVSVLKSELVGKGGNQIGVIVKWVITFKSGIISGCSFYS